MTTPNFLLPTNSHLTPSTSLAREAYNNSQLSLTHQLPTDTSTSLAREAYNNYQIFLTQQLPTDTSYLLS
jgi:hypothetical protein